VRDVVRGARRRSFFHEKFVDLSLFDEVCRSPAELAMATIRKTCETHVHATQSCLMQELSRLRAEIAQATKDEQREKREHEDLVSRLTTKLHGAAARGWHDPSSMSTAVASVVAPRPLPAATPERLRGTVAKTSGGVPSYQSAGPVSGRTSRTSVACGARVATMTPTSPAANSTSASHWVGDGEATAAAAVAQYECATTSVERFGALMVRQLGLNAYPSRPAKCSSCITRHHLGIVPRVAPSMHYAVRQHQRGNFGWSREDSSFLTDSLLF
jgi:hypothetical protein